MSNTTVRSPSDRVTRHPAERPARTDETVLLVADALAQRTLDPRQSPVKLLIGLVGACLF